MRRILIRAEGYKKIGTGHIIRCLALADMLPEFKIEFALQCRDQNLKAIVASKYKVHELPITDDYSEDLNNFLQIITCEDIVVLDGYMFLEEYQSAVVQKVRNVVIVDDLNNCIYDCDFLINHAPSFKESEYKFKRKHSRAYVGSSYALLRKPFLEAAHNNKQFNYKSKGILICLGGADPSNYSLKIVQALRQLTTELITIIVGPSNPNKDSFNELAHINVLSNLTVEEMLKNYQKHSLLILTGSGVALEAFSVRRPIGLFAYADNQIPVIKAWHDLGCANSLGDIRELNELELTHNLNTVLSLTKEETYTMQEVQTHYMDGLSDQRIRKLFEAL